MIIQGDSFTFYTSYNPMEQHFSLSFRVIGIPETDGEFEVKSNSVFFPEISN